MKMEANAAYCIFIVTGTRSGKHLNAGKYLAYQGVLSLCKSNIGLKVVKERYYLNLDFVKKTCKKLC